MTLRSPYLKVPSGASLYWMQTSVIASEFFDRTVLLPQGIPSEEAFGTPTRSTSVTVEPTGIPSAESFGVPSRETKKRVFPSGIPSAEDFGVPVCAASNASSAPVTKLSATILSDIDFTVKIASEIVTELTIVVAQNVSEIAGTVPSDIALYGSMPSVVFIPASVHA